MSCLSCGTEPSSEQPAYCTRCFIPVPLPRTRSEDETLRTRKRNRMNLVDEIIRRTPSSIEFLQGLGLEQLPMKDLAASLSAIGQEKLNFMSSEHSWTEAQTYLDLGYELAQRLESDRLKVITAQRLAMQLIRGGWLEEARSILPDPKTLGENLKVYRESEELVRAFTDLETAAELALIDAMEGKEWQREDLNTAVLHLWDLMKPDITELILKGGGKSFYLGSEDRNHKVPRLDKLAFVQSILLQAEIASSREHLSDLAVEALQVLGRMLIIMAEMAPKDDPLFYGAIIREYFQHFNGMFWHREALYENDADLVQTTIVQAHSIVIQWSELIPPQSWMEARPSRFIEVFYRASRWAEQLSPRYFLNRWISAASSDVRPYLHYFDAEALLNDGQKEKGEQILLQVLEREDIDPSLKEAARTLLQRASLESTGVFIGNPYLSRLERLEVIMEVPSGGNIGDYARLEELMGIELPSPSNLMRMEFKPVKDWLGRELAVSGTSLENLIYRTPETTHQYLNQTIVIAGSSYYRDVHWWTPFSAVGKMVNGLRTDIVVLRIKFNKDILSLLFEAEKISLEEKDDQVFIGTPDFYHLTGINWTPHPPEEVIEALVNLLEGVSMHEQLDIYTLKIDLP